MVQDWPGPAGEYPRPGGYYQQFRYSDRDEGRQDGMTDSIRRHPPMIAEALKRYCGIEADQYFLAVRKYDSSIATFFSPSQLRHDELESSFFNEERFRQATSQLGQGLQASPETYHTRSVGGAPNRTVERRQLPPVGGDDWEEVSESARKRQRPRHQSREDDQERRITSTPRRSMRLDDSPMLYEFYTTCLQEAQQTVCKLMSKAWIKVVEPKKQSMHPYTGSDAKAPSWWPKPAEENSKEGRVRHKEPDHLYKNERVLLLTHILRLAMEPLHKKHPSFQKLNIDVKKLEDATWEAISGWASESKSNTEKKGCIQEMFRIARDEERFRDGLKDGSTQVFVLPSKKDTDKGDIRDASENEEAFSPTRSTKMFGQVKKERSPASDTVTPIVGDLPMRAAPFPGHNGQILDYMSTQQLPSFETSGIPPHSHAAVNPSIPVNLIPSASVQHRRGSLFSDFNTTSQPSVFTGQWQQVSSPANTGPAYVYAGAQSHSDPQAYGNATTVPLAHPEHQGYLPHAFDSMPRHGYDQHAMFRQPDLTPGNNNQAHHYPYSSPDETDPAGGP